MSKQPDDLTKLDGAARGQNERNILLAIIRASKHLGRDPLNHPRAKALQDYIIALFAQGHRDFELVAGTAANHEFQFEKKSRR
jgi:hypothetical protein